MSGEQRPHYIHSGCGVTHKESFEASLVSLKKSLASEGSRFQVLKGFLRYVKQFHLFMKINDIFMKMQGIWQLMHSKLILSYSMTCIPFVQKKKKNTLSAAQGVLL